jgi:uncharacterized protein (TIGR03083 family)
VGLSQERCCRLVAGEIARLAAVTEGADPATPVPTCGGWSLADLLEHTGTVYRWAAAMVRDSAQERYGREHMDFDVPADPVDLPAWIAAGSEPTVEAFRDADLETPMWAWGWPKAAVFWPRRMVHEIGVHRADAELALGREVAFDPEVAADGVSELLDNLPHAAYFAPGVEKLRGDGEVLGFEATDAGVSWRVTLEPDAFHWSLDTGPASTTVRAPARDLLLALYGRPACIDLVGDDDLFDRWIANSAL